MLSIIKYWFNTTTYSTNSSFLIQYINQLILPYNTMHWHWLALKHSIFLRILILEYILFSNNYWKDSKTVIKIKFAKVKVSIVHSWLKDRASASLFKWATIQISSPEIIIQTFYYIKSVRKQIFKIWITEKAQMVLKTFYVRRE